jgi:DNA-binding transcriptional LysR family regulator
VANISQPAMSLAMRALEAEWGMPVFEKVGRQKRPTPAAIAAARRAAALHGRIATLGQQNVTAQEWLHDASLPSLRIGLAPAAALLYGPVIEKAWRAHEPEGLLRTVGGSAPELLLEVQRGIWTWRSCRAPGPTGRPVWSAIRCTSARRSFMRAKAIPCVPRHP